MRREAIQGCVWYVYVLVDPRNDRSFYVGCSIEPEVRLRAHSKDRSSSAYNFIRRLKRLKTEPVLRILSHHPSKSEGRVCEQKTIKEMPWVVNKDRNEPFWPGASLGEVALSRESFFVGGCKDGCLCAKHDPTRFTGNPNYAVEFAAKEDRRKRQAEKRGAK